MDPRAVAMTCRAIEIGAAEAHALVVHAREAEMAAPFDGAACLAHVVASRRKAREALREADARKARVQIARRACLPVARVRLHERALPPGPVEPEELADEPAALVEVVPD